MLSSEKSKNRIAKELGRSSKAIRHEIKNNGVKGEYTASKAEHKSRQKRKRSKIQCMKVAMDRELKEFVTANIEDHQSPEAISGRIKKVDKHIKYASAKAIYKFVHSVHGRKIEKHLYGKAVKKKGGPKRGAQKASDKSKTMIDKRPKSVEKRLKFGHFEGDFIESGKDGRGSLLVLVERKTRYPFIAYTEDRTTEHINNLMAEMLESVLVKSITLDNDLSFQKHEELSELLETTVFFCHPYCSYEKGSVENRNKAVRRYAKKGCDLSKLGAEQIKEIEVRLRDKFMKCLGFKTPKEAWSIETERLNKKTNICYDSGNKKTRRERELLLAKGGELQRCV